MLLKQKAIVQTLLNFAIDDIQNSVEKYHLNGSFICRSIIRRNKNSVLSKIKLPKKWEQFGYSNDVLFDKCWLMSPLPTISINISDNTLALADLFSGLGGMSLGVVEAGKALGINVVPKFAMDINKDALDTYQNNFPSATINGSNIEEVIDGNIGDKITKRERSILKELGSIDILIGGPPCQGNSDLNNHTRRKDPKNSLLLKVVRFAELFSPTHVIIENVQGVKHDKGNVTMVAQNALRSMGYNVSEDLLLASKYGVAQNRRRYFLIATKNSSFSFNNIELNYGRNERDFLWACDDLLNFDGKDTFNTSAKHSAINQNRIDYLFKNNLFELPDSQRPDCHKDGNHSYKSVYGRMYPDRPAPTITSGFGSIGQGRFGHPLEKRSITPHEAARLQFIPDSFKFLENTKRVSLQTLIGNAVPSKLSYILTLELLR